MITQDLLADIFEEWKRRYDNDPGWFQSIDEFLADPPGSYGEGASVYFLALFEERWQYDLELDKYVPRST